MRILFLLAFLSFVPFLHAQRADNYKPDNPNVILTQTNLPIVFINTGNVMIDRENRIEARMVVIYNGEGQLNYGDTIAHPAQRKDYEGLIGLKYRGNSSFTNSDKKPYAIRPQNSAGKKQNVSLLGMGADSDWALLAPYADKSLIRDVFAFQMARPYLEFVPSGKHCELILDGTYYGVYILSERVRVGTNRLNIGTPGDSGDALTGGYQLEVDRPDEEVYTSKHTPIRANGSAISGKKISFQYTSPEYVDLTENQKNYIHGYIDAFENALASADYKDPETGYRKYIDVTSFIDYMLSTEFSRNVDGYRLSTNLYKYRDSIDARFKMSLWDLNLGFGNADYYEGWDSQSWAYNMNQIAPADNQLVPFWWPRLMSDPAFMTEVKERWTTYRTGNYSGQHIQQTIDSLVNLLQQEGAQTRNSKAWPRWSQYVWPNKYIAPSYTDEINYMKGWITQRLAFMDKAFLEPKEMVDIYVPLSLTGYNADIIAEDLPAKNFISTVTDDEGWVFYGPDIRGEGNFPAEGTQLLSSGGVGYQLAPYNQNNAVYLKTSGQTVVLTLATPLMAKEIWVLGTSANGISTVGTTVHYTDGTSASAASLSFADWYSASSSGCAVYGLDRIFARAGVYGGSYTEDQFDGRFRFRLFEHKITTDPAKVVKSVTFRKSSTTGYAMILAVSRFASVSTGIEEASVSDQELSVVPNPVRRGENIRVKTPDARQIEVYSLQGSVLYRQQVSGAETIIPTDKWAPGIYLLKLKSDSGIQTAKVVVR